MINIICYEKINFLLEIRNLLFKNNKNYFIKVNNKYKINNSISKNNYINMIFILNNFIENNKNSLYKPYCIYLLGKLNLKIKNYNVALYNFAFLIKKYPNFTKLSKSLFNIGVLMELNNNFEIAIFIYNKVSKLYPNDKISKYSLFKINKIKSKNLKRDARAD